MSFIASAVVGSGLLGAGASIFGAETQANAQQAAAGTISSSLQQAISQLLGLTGQGQAAIQGYTGQGAQALTGLIQPYATMGQQAGQSLTNLLTGNPQQMQRQLQQLPGYQFQLQQGEGSVNNAATTTGLGGNVIQAQTNLASGLASSNYGQYANLLQGLTNTGVGAATVGGGALASLFGGAGSSTANLLGSAGSGISGLTSTAGQNIAQTQVGAAQAQAAGAQGVSSSLMNSLLLGGILNKTGLFSDMRLKKDIKKVGELDNDLNVYRFRFKGDPTRKVHIGLMAQEVEKVRPKAVSELLGYKVVDYGKAAA